MRKLWLLTGLVGLAPALALAQAPTSGLQINGLTAGGALSNTDLMVVFQGGSPAKSAPLSAMGTFLAGTFLSKSNNLSDLASVAAARTNLGFTFSGNTLKLTTFGAGSFVAGHQLVFDGSGNAIDGGAPGSGGTVTSLTCGTGLSGGTITTTGTCSMPNTGPGGSFTNANISLDAQGRVTAASNGSGGGGTPNQSTGAFAGSLNAYTMPFPSPAVSANSAYYRVCGSFSAGVAVNTGASNLTVGTAPALPIRKNTTSGLVALTSGDITGAIQNQCFQLDSGPNFWIMQDPPLAITQTDFNSAATTVDWTNGTNYKYVTAGKTLTLPSAAALSTNGYLFITTVGVPMTLAATGSDVINTGLSTASAAGGSIPIPADSNAIVQTSGSAGATAFTVTLSQAGAQTFMIANAASVGTTINHLAKLTGAPSTAVGTATTDAGIPSWVVVAGAGTTGKALLATGGIVQCTADANGITSGHPVVNSPTTPTDCADGGAATTEASNLAVGIALQSVGSGLFNMLALPTSVPTARETISWLPGQSLAAANAGMFRVGLSGATIVSMICRPEVLAGGAATIDLYAAPDGVALDASGVGSGALKLNTTSCDANSSSPGARFLQTLGNAITAIPAGFVVGFHGTGWGTLNGSGFIQISYIK